MTENVTISSNDGLRESQFVIRQLKAEFAAWQLLVSRLENTGSTEKIATPDRLAKDVLAHLTAWQIISVARLNAAIEGADPGFPTWFGQADPDTQNDLDAVNETIYQIYRRKDWADIRQEWATRFEGLIKLTRTLPADDLCQVDRYPWLPGYPLLAVLKGTLEHHVEHRIEVEKSLLKGD